ncbi:hypothetical protein [Streptomyces shenzhenensis]|uniref:hypothetical protein n=1 Tax=Streptomyces shenzhenensis TaxID=943815 RepID=UPI0036BCD30E
MKAPLATTRRRRSPAMIEGRLLQTLRLLEAVRGRQHDAIREIHKGLADLDSAALDRDNEFGWRLLSQVVIASAVSMMLRDD